MTDSGSFDSGDLVYGADLAALHALVVSTCSAAGVAVPGYASSVFASGSVCATAHINDLVAAYQRAWDASTNKPGTRQSQVVAGNLVYGALFQNMWTQLNQMEFTQDWSNWDEGAEADLADSNTFVCFFENPTTGGNEEGQGAGLSTADATITQYGTIPGVTNGYRTSTSSPGQCWFLSTNARSVMGGCSAWAWILKMKLHDHVRFMQWYYPSEFSIYLDRTYPDGGPGGSHARFAIGASYGTRQLVGTTVNTIPLDTTLWLAVWCDGSLVRAGFSTTRPTKLSDFAAGNLITGTGATTWPAAPFTDTLSYYTGIGQTDGYYCGMSAYYLIMSKTCLIDNNA